MIVDISALLWTKNEVSNSVYKVSHKDMRERKIKYHKSSDNIHLYLVVSQSLNEQDTLDTFWHNNNVLPFIVLSENRYENRMERKGCRNQKKTYPSRNIFHNPWKFFVSMLQSSNMLDGNEKYTKFSHSFTRLTRYCLQLLYRTGWECLWRARMEIRRGWFISTQLACHKLVFYWIIRGREAEF